MHGKCQSERIPLYFHMTSSKADKESERDGRHGPLRWDFGGRGNVLLYGVESGDDGLMIKFRFLIQSGIEHLLFNGKRNVRK